MVPIMFAGAKIGIISDSANKLAKFLAELLNHGICAICFAISEISCSFAHDEIMFYCDRQF
jgi:hypothetical protein